jgi:3-oxoacyl-[acyl-carrier protein] reductase
MKAKGYGRIVNITSIWSVVSRSGRSLYSLTKWGIIGLTKTLSIELAENNILVNSVAPGFTKTDLTESTNSKEELKTINSQIPMKRMAEPIEIANLVAFLSSNLNTYITGQNIVIDGGYTNV